MTLSSKKIYWPILFLLLFACEKSQVSRLQQAAFSEKYRPQFHFSPPLGWMNDPNGMVYYEGEYHLFYQYYPDSTVWGPMHWGHAVSKNMVEWENLSIALYPDSLGYIFSGSAVVDWQNTTGFGSDNNPPLVAIFTHHNMEKEKAGILEDEVQSLAYSLDKGRTWVKYENNPVIHNPGIGDFRDPKVIWDKNTDQWILALAVKDHVNFYTSSNLKDWKKESEFGSEIGAHGGVWECPDLFPIVDEKGIEKWVLLLSINPGGPHGGSATQYFIGDFDGSVFTPDDANIRWIDIGADNYAGVTWSDIPEQDGRRLFLGWMGNWLYAQVVPTDTWRSAMTIPRELQLKKSHQGYQLFSKPVKEMEVLFDDTEIIKTETYTLSSETHKINIKDLPKDSFDIEFSNAQGEKTIIGLKDGFLYIDRKNAGVSAFSPDFAGIQKSEITRNGIASLEIFMDRSSVEVFANDGEVVMTALVFPSKSYETVKFNEFSNRENISITTLRSIW